MSSLSAKDRVSLCMFSFADGRRCRSPRVRNNPHFCFYHAEKEARASAAQNLGKDFDYFFSGNYLSACDLSTALGRIIPAVIRGDVKPKTARTVAYMAQTLLQAIHVSQHEYINTFDTGGWRKSIRNSVNGNYDYRFPFTPSEAEGPDPAPETPPDQAPVVAGLQTGGVQAQQPAPAARTASTSPVCHPERSEGSHPLPAAQSARSAASAPQPAPSPHTSLPPTSAEFVQHMMAGQNSSRPPRPVPTGSGASQGPSRQPDSAAPNPASQSPTAPPTPSSQLPTAQPTTSPTQASTVAQQPTREAPEPLRPVAVAPSASRQEAQPAAGPQTGPSGLPVLAPLPPRKPGAPPGSYSS
jgi:hypothetical protein